jgi:hypothetical protein
MHALPRNRVFISSQHKNTTISDVCTHINEIITSITARRKILFVPFFLSYTNLSPTLLLNGKGCSRGQIPFDFHEVRFCSSYLYTLSHSTSHILGRAKAQVVSRRPLTAEAWVRAPVSLCGICGGQSGTGTGFSPSSSIFPCQYHSTVALQLVLTEE